MRKVLVTAAAAFAAGVSAHGLAGGWTDGGQPAEVRAAKLPLELPSVGDVDAAQKWVFGRVHSIAQRGAEELDVQLRLAGGRTESVRAAREPLGTLARACGWVQGDGRVVAGRAEYAERMIAVGVDRDGRMVAAISLEPFDRDLGRLRRATR